MVESEPQVVGDHSTGVDGLPQDVLLFQAYTDGLKPVFALQK